MELLNLSSLSTTQCLGYLPKDLRAKKVVIFPDICKVNWLLPTGIVVLTDQEDWRRFAVSDIGCGMLLCKSNIKRSEFDRDLWDKTYFELKATIKRIIELSTGNHFIDAIYSIDNEQVYFLIHNGTPKNPIELTQLANNPIQFDATCDSLITKAKDGRYFIYRILNKIFGNLSFVFDKIHNSYEKSKEGVIIRRGAVKVGISDNTIIPSCLSGDIALVNSTKEVENTLFSLNHGTGRVIQQGFHLEESISSSYSNIRDLIYIPKMIKDSEIIYDLPNCYRSLDECLELVKEFIVVQERFRVLAYLGHI
jgi:hypothetical protein